MLLKRCPADLATAEEALLTAIAVAKRQATRSFELRAALALAKLYRSNGRHVDAHAVLASALEGFAPTPEMPEIAEARALLAALAETDEVKADAARRQRQGQLQIAYGNALFAARGFAAPETAEAFAKARSSTAAEKDAPERFAADFGLWAAAYTRGDLPSMRAHAEEFLADVEARPQSPEAGVAYRVQGITLHFAGRYREAKGWLERALALFEPGRDDDMLFRFGPDPGVSAMAYLAFALWPLGEIDRAVSLIERMQSRMAALTQASTLSIGKMYAVQFAQMRAKLGGSTANALELSRIAREHDLAQFRAFGTFFEGLATAESDLIGGLQGMRRGAQSLREQNVRVFDGLVKIALAKAEASAGDADLAIAILDEALATAERLDYRAFEAELHRARGEMLLSLNPGNSAGMEALRTAIAVASEQNARSFQLRATLALAKLYQSTGHPAEAHYVLAPALEGFSPTAEMPEIAEAQALLAAVAESDEVKAESARRERLARLQAAYGNALIWARGYEAPETAEAFARARESAIGDAETPERLAADFGLWAGSYLRGDLPAMGKHVAAFLADVEAKPDSPEAGIAYRSAGITRLFAGEYVEAKSHLERALALFEPGRDDDLAFRFAHDAGIHALAYLAHVSWPLGEVDRAVALIERMQARIAELKHVGSLVFGRNLSAIFDLLRGSPARAAPNVFELARLARDHELPLFRAFAEFLEGWVNEASGAADGLANMRRGVELLRERRVLTFDGLFKVALAQAEARAGDTALAVIIIDESLVTCKGAGYRAYEAELHRARGELLLQSGPPAVDQAEEALQIAVAVAQCQKARSFGLRAALSLGKLYQSTGRPAEAHGLLASALAGFPATQEMPEIAEVRALMEHLA
jgi:tetratricopeptide (TPR) repeat protein